MSRAFMSAFALVLSSHMALADDCNQLTRVQVAAGYVTSLNVIAVFAIAIFVISFVVLFKQAIVFALRVFAVLPFVLYEVVAYASSIALIVAGHFVDPINMIWFVLTGCLLFAGILALSISVRDLSIKPVHAFQLLTIVWGITALIYTSDIIGVIAVLAFMGSVGFSAAVIPMGYAVGFQDGAVPRGTATALIVLAATLVWRLLRPGVPNPFEMGGLYVGSFVFFLGLLILASRFYPSAMPGDYVTRQLAPILCGLAAIIVGNVAHVPSVAGIGGTFLALYLVEKVTDIPFQTVTQAATVGFFASALVGGSVWWGQHHLDLLKSYLLF